MIIIISTIINKKKYYAFKSYWPDENNPQIRYFRDSSKNLVDNFGNVHFSETNYIDILSYREHITNETDTLFTLSWKMVEGTSSISVPGGVFNVLNYQGIIKTHLSSQSGVEIVERTLNKYYAPNVGMVLDTYCWITITYYVIERRLVRYHIEEE